MARDAEAIIAQRLDVNAGPADIRAALHTLCGIEVSLLAVAHSREKGKLSKDAERLLDKVVGEIARLIDTATVLANKRPDLVKSDTTLGMPGVDLVAAKAAAAAADGPQPAPPATQPAARGATTEAAAAPAPASPMPQRAPPGQEAIYGHNTATYSRQAEQRVQAAGPPEIPPSEIIFDKEKDHLGGGAFGSVFRATVKGKLVAVKVPLKQQLTQNEMLMFKHEVAIMRKIFHPNIVLCLGACVSPGNLMLVTELLQMDMEQLIHTAGLFDKLTVFSKLQMARDAVYGMNWLHGICKIVHRDLKPANLLLDEHNRVKVTDFGFSETIRQNRNMKDMKGPKGTALYMAPEVMGMREFNEKADVYSFGLIMYELFTGLEPFSNYSDIDTFYNAVCVRHERPVIPPERRRQLPPTLVQLIYKCWDKQADVRPLFPEVLHELEVCMVESQIENAQARAFWQANFFNPLQEVVSTDEFAGALRKALALDDSNAEALDAFQDFIGVPQTASSIIDSSVKVVSMQRFNQFFLWFGPFVCQGAGNAIFAEITELLGKDWFHGDLSRDASEIRLMKKDEGTFLVRLSYSDERQTPFTISKVRKTPVHKRVQRLDYDPTSERRLSVQVKNTTVTSRNLVEMIVQLQELGNLRTACSKDDPSALYINK
eukprot:TRINITY_DN6714_c0_g1_i1.p1 TRINITY_DN6714_c0_g1~~TRINITY_DN6714_c0_g1_i1.p1  ORF type:complete len:685 (+),score=198.09 TRINITY_DN6714_c0_g1_i1:86-2056(+)